MKTIEKLEDFNSIKLQYQFDNDDECILRVYDNKSDILIQSLVVKHPITFIRGLQEYCKSVSLPVSDIDTKLIGFISADSGLKEVAETPTISPYIYFTKPKEDVDSSDNN